MEYVQFFVIHLIDNAPNIERLVAFRKMSSGFYSNLAHFFVLKLNDFESFDVVLASEKQD